MDLHMFDMCYQGITDGVQPNMIRHETYQDSEYSASAQSDLARLGLQLPRQREDDAQLLSKISSMLSKVAENQLRQGENIGLEEGREDNESGSSGYGSISSRPGSVEPADPVNEQQGRYKNVELTPLERDTFMAEGIPLPNGGHLTKTQERALKRIRRKIKNKLSAQESRRKKKEYVETLEKRLESFILENNTLRDRVSSLDNTIKGLLTELQGLRNESNTNTREPQTKSRSVQTGICLKCYLKKH
ncbi:cyclic AMP-responsive element-binding protein 3-like protein 1 [Nematostella vectensis]|uniref:cyclic AMP-responsive element-binding protein 3-like protein 1 n=1 Tax=Nematostella vectensis TaxID=45351 RepID=UPI00207716D1|nr:cyclic AMP-responsive element-binding protein 3-like protein 1 [Nematostella vectensis]XP_048579004.1 cyclic AMP-responsive element-binding protein 3-like protein 1 [Nematostella vectensis]